jgi:GrpB-like predicted nucleotidyltransferase (UPF0157 family)
MSVNARPELVVPYDATWPDLFDLEQARLEDALAPWLDGGIHHIGSTAVPGLSAKPIIDVIAGVRDLDEARAGFPRLEALGYAYRVHRPEAHSLHRAGYHLHLTEPDSDIWRERLAFRDALRRDPELRREYEEWKRAHAGPDGYDETKWPFVARVLAGAGITLKPDAERLTTVS